MQQPRHKATPGIAQRRKARRLIMQALYQWQLNGGELTEIEAQFRSEFIGKTDWDYFHEVFTAIPGQAAELQGLLVPYLDRDFKALDPVEKAILWIGAFELKYRIEIPYRVVINESIELAKSFGATESHKYINGILDKLVKDLRPREKRGSVGD
ncbi:MAG: transcription antitermination factor NusB [Gammaproteobacteria bacterium]